MFETTISNLASGDLVAWAFLALGAMGVLCGALVIRKAIRLGTRERPGPDDKKYPRPPSPK